MTLNLSSVMLGSENSKRLADFYAKVFGAPEADWSDPGSGWFGFKAGNGGLVVGPHSEVKGKSEQPGRLMFNLETADVRSEFDRIKGAGAEVVAEPYEPGGQGSGMWMATFADPDGNYFQLASPWDRQAS